MNEGLCGWDTVSIVVGVGEIKIKGSTTFCQGNSAILKVEPKDYGYSYIWNTGDTTNSVIIKNSGLYIVKVDNKYGCIHPHIKHQS